MLDGLPPTIYGTPSMVAGGGSMRGGLPSAIAGGITMIDGKGRMNSVNNLFPSIKQDIGLWKADVQEMDGKP